MAEAVMRELLRRNGLAEALKMAATCDADLFATLEAGVDEPAEAALAVKFHDAAETEAGDEVRRRCGLVGVLDGREVAREGGADADIDFRAEGDVVLRHRIEIPGYVGEEVVGVVAVGIEPVVRLEGAGRAVVAAGDAHVEGVREMIADGELAGQSGAAPCLIVGRIRGHVLAEGRHHTPLERDGHAFSVLERRKGRSARRAGKARGRNQQCGCQKDNFAIHFRKIFKA